MKEPKVPSFYIESEFDYWVTASSNKVSGAFSENAKKHGRVELKNFDNIHEYSLYRYFQGLDGVGASDAIEMLGTDLQ